MGHPYRDTQLGGIKQRLRLKRFLGYFMEKCVYQIRGKVIDGARWLGIGIHSKGLSSRADVCRNRSGKGGEIVAPQKGAPSLLCPVGNKPSAEKSRAVALETGLFVSKYNGSCICIKQYEKEGRKPGCLY